MSETFLLQHLSVGPLQVNCFLVACPVTHEAMIVDPGDDEARILAMVKAAGVTVTQVVNTHGHFDHIGANRQVVATTGASLLLHKADLPLLHNAQNHAGTFGLQVDPSPDPDRLLQHGDQIKVGTLQFEVIHIPGHSPGGISLYGHGHLFVGDILFAGSIGRTDLPGGDHDALVEGIREHLLVLPDDTVVHTGHGPDTTIGREKSANPYVGRNAWNG